ncbi:hypothetical protein Tco_0235932 [Tanacetum coccineum]
MEAPSCSDTKLLSEKEYYLNVRSAWSPLQSIAWKIPNKPLLNTYPRVPMKREAVTSSARETFCEISNMTHDPPEGVVRFTNGNNEVTYKMRHKIEQYDSLSNLEKEQTKSVYLMNEEDKRRGVEYVMSTILGFYKECLKLRHEYLTRMDDEGEVT